MISRSGPWASTTTSRKGRGKKSYLELPGIGVVVPGRPFVDYTPFRRSKHDIPLFVASVLLPRYLVCDWLVYWNLFSKGLDLYGGCHFTPIDLGKVLSHTKIDFERKSTWGEKKIIYRFPTPRFFRYCRPISSFFSFFSLLLSCYLCPLEWGFLLKYGTFITV